ncbi:MAG: hypothetical protein AB8B55_03875 [Mariniblastus sp.]
MSVDKNAKVEFPENGLALRETMRDLPRPKQARALDKWRHNFDQVWITTDEASAFLPTEVKLDAEIEIDEPILNRLGRFHFVDHVRGSATAWDKDDIKSGTLKSRITKINDSEIHLELSGAIKISQKPSGKINPFLKRRITKDRGLDLSIAGRLIYDRKSESFKRFDIAAFGDRWGTDVYNHRHNDMGPDPIGFAFSLDTSKSAKERTPLFARRGDYL